MDFKQDQPYLVIVKTYFIIIIIDLCTWFVMNFGLFLGNRHFLRLRFHFLFLRNNFRKSNFRNNNFRNNNFRFQFFPRFLHIRHYPAPLFESLHLLDIAAQPHPQGQLAKIHPDRARHHAVHRGNVVELVLRIVQYILDAQLSPGHYKTFVVLLVDVHLKYHEF